MDIAIALLLLGATIAFLLAALGIAARVNLVAVGLLLWVLVPLIHAVNTLR